MRKIIVLIGISGSGKSTYAKDYVEKNSNTVIVSRDAIRMALFGYTEETYSEYYKGDISEREKIVSDFFDAQVWTALEKGLDVIADNTHLNKSYINKYQMFGVWLQHIAFEADYDMCVERDAKRKKSVGEAVIAKQIKQFHKLMASDYYEEIGKFNSGLLRLKGECKAQEFDESKKSCLVFDLDGTLAHNNGRSPYDYSKVYEDSIDLDIAWISDLAKQNTDTDVIICTGRDAICKEETKKWLTECMIAYDDLYMRAEGDKRKDNIVKAELFNKIQEKYNIIAIFEDRKRVVSMARELGYKVCQVDEGNF